MIHSIILTRSSEERSLKIKEGFGNNFRSLSFVLQKMM
jgi:hypothetical protein